MITAIDLGSNSFRVVVLDCLTYKIFGEYEETVGTADGLMTTGKISNEACDRVITAIKNSIKKLEFDPAKAICKTTAAMRKATNSEEVLKKIHQDTGLVFEVISGEEEARLTMLAIKNAIKREKLDGSNFVFVDIGGGSCELVVVQGDKTLAKSFDFGIVTLTQSQNNITEFLETKKQAISDFLKGIDLSDTIFVSTAGTPTTIAAIKLGLKYSDYDRNKVNGTILFENDIDEFRMKLKVLSLEQVEILVGVRRTPFMEAGALIFKMFFEALKKSQAVIFDDGLREGIAIDWCEKRYIK